MDDALFHLDTNPDAAVLQGPTPAREEQIDAIRKGLDLAGITSQDGRRAFVASAILSEVDSLRALTALQARQVIDKLKTSAKRQSPSGGSLWDNREEDTWIDRL